VTTKAIYCSKCRDANGHHIARGKSSPEIFRRVTVAGRNSNGSYRCRCECGHTWSSTSQEAATLYNQAAR
jgi:hypothetical protein